MRYEDREVSPTYCWECRVCGTWNVNHDPACEGCAQEFDVWREDVHEVPEVRDGVVLVMDVS